MPDSPSPNAPYRTPWEPARRVVHPGAYASPAALRRELLDLRQRVDARQHGDLSADDLAQTIRELTDARDRLRDFARPTRGVLVTVAATFTGSGLLLAFLKMPSHAWIALGVAMATAMVAALASEWAQRWLDAVPEDEGLIADLRKQTTGRAHSTAPVEEEVVEAVRWLLRDEEGTSARKYLSRGLISLLQQVPAERVRVALEEAQGDTRDGAESTHGVEDDEKRRGER